MKEVASASTSGVKFEVTVEFDWSELGNAFAHESSGEQAQFLMYAAYAFRGLSLLDRLTQYQYIGSAAPPDQRQQIIEMLDGISTVLRDQR